MWTRNPLSTAAIVLTLALCIGANTVLLSGVNFVSGDQAEFPPLLPFRSFRMMDDVRYSSLANQRFRATLLAIMAAIALTLAAIGVYGLIANSIVERTREFGIRMALGATLGQVIRAAAVPGFIMAAVGVAIGFALAQPATSLLQGLLWGVTPADPLTFGAGAGGLLLVALAASLIPAMRIIGLEPASTLRHD